MNEIINEEKCSVCEKSVNEYDKSWECKANHNWRRNWRKDKTTEKYKKFLEKRNKAMKKAWRKRLDKLNKKTPAKYASRRGSTILQNTPIIKRKRFQSRKHYETEDIL